MLGRMDFAPLMPFDPHSAPSSIGQRWQAWRRRFETYLRALNITNTTRQRALLLYQVGQATQEIFDTIPENGADDDYATALATLDAYFLPKKSVDFEIFQFRQAKQRPDETVSQYATRLRQLAAHCEFNNVDTEIKSAIIQNCASKRLRRYVLREENLTLTSLLSKASALETSENQAVGIEQTLEQALTLRHKTTERPRKPSHRSSRKQNAPCGNCGFALPHHGPCPAKGKNCNACGKRNHFAKVCRTVKKPNSQGKHLPHVPIHRLTEESNEHCPPYTSPPTSDDEFLFTLASTSTKTPIVKVKINDQPVKMLLDTGASTDILDKATYDKLSAVKPIALTKSPVNIFAYGSQSPLPVVGKFDATIESKRNISVSTIYVLEGSAGSLLSYNTANDLGLIKLSVNATNGKPFASDTLKERFPQLFNGIGCLRNFEVKLHIDERIPSVAQAARRIPFHMRRKVSEALNELEKQDIIERVDGPTPYISPLVVIPKKDGSVRLCVDMRIPNKAIQRTRHPSPTIDDLIHIMNGATVFSKLDLKSGYHQLTLAPSGEARQKWMVVPSTEYRASNCIRKCESKRTIFL